MQTEIEAKKRDYGIFHVGLKVLMQKGDKFLFLRDETGKIWDWPGGRIDNLEMKTPLDKIIAREVKEELGPDVKYKLGSPIFQFRRYFKSRDIWIFQTYYLAKYISGKIKLSHEHTVYEWVTPEKIKSFKTSEFYSPEEKKIFLDYFKSI